MPGTSIKSGSGYVVTKDNPNISDFNAATVNIATSPICTDVVVEVDNTAVKYCRLRSGHDAD